MASSVILSGMWTTVNLTLRMILAEAAPQQDLPPPGQSIPSTTQEGLEVISSRAGRRTDSGALAACEGCSLAQSISTERSKRDDRARDSNGSWNQNCQRQRRSRHWNLHGCPGMFSAQSSYPNSTALPHRLHSNIPLWTSWMAKEQCLHHFSSSKPKKSGSPPFRLVQGEHRSVFVEEDSAQ